MKKYLIIVFAVLLLTTACEIMPHNNLPDCMKQCKDSRKPKACIDFCDCIHNEGQPLESCLDKYNKVPYDTGQTQLEPLMPFDLTSNYFIFYKIDKYISKDQMLY